MAAESFAADARRGGGDAGCDHLCLLARRGRTLSDEPVRRNELRRRTYDVSSLHRPFGEPALDFLRGQLRTVFLSSSRSRLHGRLGRWLDAWPGARRRPVSGGSAERDNTDREDPEDG